MTRQQRLKQNRSSVKKTINTPSLLAEFIEYAVKRNRIGCDHDNEISITRPNDTYEKIAVDFLKYENHII
jgi:hypothetical protein